MASIFISHASDDNEAAAEMRTWLRGDGTDEFGFDSLFLDFTPDDGIHTGEEWRQVLFDRLRQCQAIVLSLIHI